MSDELILGLLNPQQKIAVQTTEGPLLVFAGAGSGKTRVITNRIAYIITQEKVPAENILAVTFTKKAAGEMQERVLQLLKELGVEKQGVPLIGTFHSIGAFFLRQNAKYLGLSSNFSIYDSDDSDKLVRDILIEQDIDIKQIKPKAISYFISAAKNELIDPEKFSHYYGGFLEDITSEIYPLYQKQLMAQNAVDFGDLIYLTVKLLSENREVLSKYHEKYRYMMIDEYQDTNTAQYILSKLLSEKYQIKNIQSFEKDFKNVKVVKLEQNYRSSANVITAATAVIQQNFLRIDKKLWTAKDAGKCISVYQAQDQENEAEYVVDEITRLRREGINLVDIAILYRTNYQSRAIEEALLKVGLPYKLVGGFRFYERKEIKDILSYLKFLYNLKDDLSITRILNTPPRKIGTKSVAKLNAIAKQCNCSLGELIVGTYILIRRVLFRSVVREDIYTAIKQNIAEMDKYSSLVDQFGGIYMQSKGLEVLSVNRLDDGSEEAEYKKENIEELKSVAGSYALEYRERSLEVFLQEIALIEQEQEKNQDGSGNYVNLMTLHSSKGLEFDNVFIVGVEEGILPHSRSFTDENELEEERRLCYVGITRAKEKLYLTFAERRLKREGYAHQIPSRFLGEIPQDICDYYSWQS